MEQPQKANITVSALVNAPIEKVWMMWISPEHIVHWNAASDDWHTTAAENDLTVGGKCKYRMEAKDGSMGFDFEGTYTNIKERETIEFVLDDGRKVALQFEITNHGVNIAETFEAENTNSIDLQKAGWQAILNNFKSYVEQHQTL